jgi:hypothetical protein
MSWDMFPHVGVTLSGMLYKKVDPSSQTSWSYWRIAIVFAIVISFYLE